MDKILKQFEKQVKENVKVNCDKQRKEIMSVTSKSDTQQSNMQEHIVNCMPAKNKKEESLRHTPVHRNREKPDENTNTCTQYGRIVKKQDRLT